MSISKLSPDQVEAVLRAARPLSPSNHAAFLEEVGSALADCAELGEGVIHRVVRDVQRRYWNPPADGRAAIGPMSHRR